MSTNSPPETTGFSTGITFHLHLVSDSTGETVSTVARAALVQFDDLQTVEHTWSMVRTGNQVAEVIAGIKANPGFVLYTLVDPDLRKTLEEGCQDLGVPCIALLDPVVAALGAYAGARVHARPGRQHEMDSQYFHRIEAMHYILGHDDGQGVWDLDGADVIMVGFPAPRRRRPASIWPTGESRPPTCPWCPGCRCRIPCCRPGDPWWWGSPAIPGV